MPTLTPVDHDPFASAGPTLTPVDHNPFAAFPASITDRFANTDSGAVFTEADAQAASQPTQLGDAVLQLSKLTGVGLLPQLAGGLAGGLHAAVQGSTPIWLSAAAEGGQDTGALMDALEQEDIAKGIRSNLNRELGIRKNEPDAIDTMRNVTEKLSGAMEPTTKAGEIAAMPANALGAIFAKAGELGGEGGYNLTPAQLANFTPLGGLVQKFGGDAVNKPMNSPVLGALGETIGNIAPAVLAHKVYTGARGGIDAVRTANDVTSTGNAGIGGDLSTLPPAETPQSTQATLAKDVVDTASAIAASQKPGVPNGPDPAAGGPVGGGVPGTPLPQAPEAAARAAATDAAPGVARPLPPETPVDASKSVPLAGGIAEKSDGPVVALDKRLPQTVTVPDRTGKPVTIDVHDAVSAHERTEHPIMHEDGKDYGTAHDIATQAENAYVEQKYNVDPQVYQKAIAEHVEPIQAAATGAKDIPPTLDRKPYVGDEHLLEEQKTPSNVPAEESKPTGNPITDRLSQKLHDHYDEAKAEYADHPDTEGGRVINTDIARELSPDYVKDRTKSADVHEPASAFMKRYYADKLAEPSAGDGTVMFTAGGTGAGKSTGLAMAREAGANPDIVYDTNMNKLDSSVQKIDQALDSGRNVNILYTHRDPVEAFRHGALKRAMRQEGDFGSGRTVPLDEHVKTHVGANDTIRKLAEKYKDDPRVSVRVIDNSHGKGNATEVPLDKLPAIDENGLHEKLAQTRDEAHAAGEISDAVHKGFGGQTRPVPESGIRPEVRSGLQQESPPAQSGQEPNRVTPPQGPEARASASPDGARADGSPLSRQPEAPTKESGDNQNSPAGTKSPSDGAPQSEQVGSKPSEGISIANKPTNADRLTRGVEELVSEHGTSHADVFKKAAEAAKTDSMRGQRVASEIMDGRRGVTREDVADLLVDRVRISNEYDAVTQNFDKATDDIGRAEAQLHLDLLSDQLDLNEQASRRAGTEASWALSSRRLIAQKDYTLANQMKQSEILRGQKLSGEEAASVKAHVARIAELEKKLAEANERAKPPRGERKPVEQRKREVAQKKVDKLRDQITQRLKACPL